MLDNILNSVRRGAGRVQRRGEEVAQITRLRVEIFGLTRELDTLYARLGRSYHSGADLSVLQGVRDEISRVDDEISARERLIRELGEGQGEVGETQVSTSASRSEITSPSGPTEPTVPDAVPRPHETAELDHGTGTRTITLSASSPQVRIQEVGSTQPDSDSTDR